MPTFCGSVSSMFGMILFKVVRYECVFRNSLGNYIKFPIFHAHTNITQQYCIVKYYGLLSHFVCGTTFTNSVLHIQTVCVCETNIRVDCVSTKTLTHTHCHIDPGIPVTQSVPADWRSLCNTLTEHSVFGFAACVCVCVCKDFEGIHSPTLP